jgi:hypothetical protein
MKRWGKIFSFFIGIRPISHNIKKKRINIDDIYNIFHRNDKYYILKID